MASRIAVSRVLSFEYKVDLSSYPGMTIEEAVAYEKGLSLSDVAELLEYQKIKSFVIAEIDEEDGNG